MGVLDGIKILELARVPPAELPGMMLADVGADVLKIETPEPDRPSDAEWVRRTLHTFTNRNKRSMSLNMKSADGQEIFRRLATAADVVVEGFRPGVMKRLGADYETLRKLNPRLVYCSLSGFGQDGPYKDYPAHDMNYLSLAGVLNLIGEPGRKPAIPLNLVADYAGASPPGARSRRSSGRATATSGTSASCGPTSASARFTRSTRWCGTRSSTTAR